MGQEEKDRLFVGIHHTGIVYADKEVEQDGDYKKLAFLSFDTLELQLEEDCPENLQKEIEKDVCYLQREKGKEFPISGSGQTVTLGFALQDDENIENQKTFTGMPQDNPVSSLSL